MDSVKVATGIITSAGETLAVNVAGAFFPASLPVGYEPELGDIVNVIVATDRCFVFAVTGKSTTEIEAPTRIETGTDKFLPGSAGYYRIVAGQEPRWANTTIAQGDFVDSATGVKHTYHGAWFYGVNPTRLAGRTINRLRLWLPTPVYWGRKSAETMRLDIHLLSDQARPIGDATPIQGPVYQMINRDEPGQWIDLPPAWGEHLTTFGGGIGLRGSDPFGLATPTGGTAYLSDLASGQIEFTWQINP